MKYKIRKGKPYPIGASLEKNGVNFCIFSPYATKVELLLFNSKDDINPVTIPFSETLNKTHYYWHAFVEGIQENQLYGYRIDGPYNKKEGNLFDHSKVLIDPYSKVITGKSDRKIASTYGVNNVNSCFKSAVVSDEYDWEGVKTPDFKFQECIIYEMHVKGFTMHESSGLDSSIRGTFKGVLEKLDYLKKLGINTIELLPIYSFDEQDAPPGLSNYWGYSPLNFFSLNEEFSSEEAPQDKIHDFKNFVKTLHKEGFKVVLDVVYNHTTENDAYGPTYCFRGIANQSYYMLDENGNYKDYTGCGNTLNTNHSVLRRMIRHSLRYWVEECRIDGFRFDLASVLSRDEDGNPMQNPPILWSIDSEPKLANTMLIAEAWDAAGLYQTDDFAGDKWIVWNGRYRDVFRKFLKGDEGLSYIAMRKFTALNTKDKGRYMHYTPKRLINFITAHDGFTMHDLCTYQEKQNYENKEFGRDGSNENFNWNCGVEGETDDAHVNNLRLKFVKNYFASLILSHGLPMIVMGDEIRRTQKGNNNAYCQDNDISWMNWDNLDTHKETYDWVSKLIKIRKKFRIFSYNNYFETYAQLHKPFIIYHGLKRNTPTWNIYDRHFAMEIIYPEKEEHLYIVFNMYWEKQTFEIPIGKWEILIYSEKEEITPINNTLTIQGRSVCLMEKIMD
ncbi:MAG: glycogen-debranching protein [Flavobacteriales bacterium]|nr:glycogen-debranching protein [Flavobacteriales bacterium]